jgi:hypothetical protein
MNIQVEGLSGQLCRTIGQINGRKLFLDPLPHFFGDNKHLMFT